MRPTAPTLLLAAALLAATVQIAADEDPGSGTPASERQASAAASPAGNAGESRQAASTPVIPPVPVTEAGPQLLTEDLRDGVGEPAHSGMSVAVHYTGWLYDPGALGYRGRKFDSSRDRGQPFIFGLGAGRVIKGWELGVVGMRVGGLRRLVIPPELAYGNRAVGNGLIPPNSTLVFEVELLGVESRDFVRNAR